MRTVDRQAEGVDGGEVVLMSCPRCGAVVQEDDRHLHELWHTANERLAELVMSLNQASGALQAAVEKLEVAP